MQRGKLEIQKKGEGNFVKKRKTYFSSFQPFFFSFPLFSLSFSLHVLNIWRPIHGRILIQEWKFYSNEVVCFISFFLFSLFFSVFLFLSFFSLLPFDFPSLFLKFWFLFPPLERGGKARIYSPETIALAAILLKILFSLSYVDVLCTLTW